MVVTAVATTVAAKDDGNGINGDIDGGVMGTKQQKAFFFAGNKEVLGALEKVERIMDVS